MTTKKPDPEKDFVSDGSKVIDLTWEVTEAEVRIKGKGFTARMPKEEFLRLINSEYMGQAFKKEEEPNKHFADLDNIEIYAGVHRLLDIGFDLNEVSRAMNIPADKLRAYWNYAVINNQTNTAHKEAVNVLHEKWLDMIPTVPGQEERIRASQFGSPPKPGRRMVNARTIVQLQRVKKLWPAEIAKEMGLEYGSLSEWLKINSYLLDFMR